MTRVIDWLLWLIERLIIAAVALVAAGFAVAYAYFLIQAGAYLFACLWSAAAFCAWLSFVVAEHGDRQER